VKRFRERRLLCAGGVRNAQVNLGANYRKVPCDGVLGRFPHGVGEAYLVKREAGLV